MNQSIKVSGLLKITSTDVKTGKILHVDEGDNLVLDTGLEDLAYLLAGNIVMPTDLVSGSVLNTTEAALPHIPLWGQFGSNGTTPSATDHSQYFNGTLDDLVTTPTNASEIVRATTYSPLPTKVTFQFFLNAGQGNGPGVEGRLYREAVLMSRVSDEPYIYRWFARRTFGDVVKNNTTLLSAEWTFTFVADRSEG